MKAAALVLTILTSAVILAPSDSQMTRALRRSDPRPELEPYFLKRLAEGREPAGMLREIIRIRRIRGDRSGEIALRDRLAEIAPDDSENLEEMLTVNLWENRTPEAWAAASRLIALLPDRRDLRERMLELAEFSGRPADARVHALWLLERGVRHPRMINVFIAAKDAAGLAAVIASPRERARALVAAGAQKEAMLAYAERLAEDPRDVEARRELARLYVWNGRVLDAVAELEALLALTRDPAVREEILALCRSANRIDLMIPHLAEGIERAEILVALGRLDEAMTLYRKLGRFDRLLELALGMPLEDEEIVVREQMPMVPENRRRLADLYTWGKNFSKALPLYESLDDERTVDLYLALGDMDGAIRTARRLKLHQRLGDLHLWSGDLHAAIAEYEQVPGDPCELARLYIMVGRRVEAVRILETLTGDPYVLAELFMYAGRGDRAREILEAIPPDQLDLWMVERLAKAADLETAEALYTLLLKRNPGKEPYLRALADIYEWRGRKDAAERTLRALLAIHPREAALHARLGLLLRDRTLLERAVALGSRDPQVLRTLGEIAYSEGRWKAAIAFFRDYHLLKKDDYETLFLLAEMTGDAAEYERAWKSLPANERSIRLRILLWRKDLAGAMALLREKDDPEGREVLVDLLLEAGRENEALSFGMTVRQRAILAARRGRHEEAVALFRQLDLTQPHIRRALAESLLALNRWKEADDLVPGISMRARAVLAMRQGRFEEAVALLRKLDLTDPDVRSALAESLLALKRWKEADDLIPGISARPRALLAMREGRYEEALTLLLRLKMSDPEIRAAYAQCLLALGRWQEAEKYASGEMQRDIQGLHGPEASGAIRMYEATDESHLGFSARYRMHLSEPFYIRVDLTGSRIEGRVAALAAEEQSRTIERGETTFQYMVLPELRMAAGVAVWRGEGGGETASGVFEAELRKPSWSAGFSGELEGPWMDSIEAAVAGGVRHRLEGHVSISPISGLTLLGALERFRYEAREDLDLELEGEIAKETRVRARADLRLWTGEGTAGRHFFDLPLRNDYVIETHVGIGAQADHGETEGSEELLGFAQMIPRSRMYTAGPTAGLAGGGWGAVLNAFVGLDPERDLDFGKLWGGSIGAVGTLSEQWKLSSSFEYVSEQRTTFGGSGWTLTVGLNSNF